MSIYFVRRSSQKYKIGKSKDVKRRLAQLQTASDKKLEIYLEVVCGNYDDLEKKMHNLFADQRIMPKSEWFQINRHQIDSINFDIYCAKYKKIYHESFRKRIVFHNGKYTLQHATTYSTSIPSGTFLFAYRAQDKVLPKFRNITNGEEIFIMSGYIFICIPAKETLHYVQKLSRSDLIILINQFASSNFEIAKYEKFDIGKNKDIDPTQWSSTYCVLPTNKKSMSIKACERKYITRCSTRLICTNGNVYLPNQKYFVAITQIKNQVKDCANLEAFLYGDYLIVCTVPLTKTGQLFCPIEDADLDNLIAGNIQLKNCDARLITKRQLEKKHHKVVWFTDTLVDVFGGDISHYQVYLVKS